jgi:hypothetical protein
MCRYLLTTSHATITISAVGRQKVKPAVVKSMNVVVITASWSIGADHSARILRRAFFLIAALIALSGYAQASVILGDATHWNSPSNLDCLDVPSMSSSNVDFFHNPAQEQVDSPRQLEIDFSSTAGDLSTPSSSLNGGGGGDTTSALAPFEIRMPTLLLLSWLEFEEALDIPPAPPVSMCRPPRHLA